MEQPTLTVKNVKISTHLSQETLAFTATLYVDGKRAAFVRNDGRGGSHRYDVLDRAAFARAEGYARAAALEFDFDRLDQVVDALLGAYETRRWIRRQSKSVTLFRTPDLPEGQYRTLARPYSAEAEAVVLARYPNATVYRP